MSSKNFSQKTLSQKIKEDYGTLTFFCKKHQINISTFKIVIYGHGKSKRIVDILKTHKYIKNAEELKKPRATSILSKRQVKGYIKSKNELKRE